MEATFCKLFVLLPHTDIETLSGRVEAAAQADGGLRSDSSG